MKAYVKTCSIRQDGSKDSFLTVSVECKESPRPRYGVTLSGYGAAVPTDYMVKYNDKWRRVKCIIYSNIGTLYIGKKYDGQFIVIIER